MKYSGKPNNKNWGVSLGFNNELRKLNMTMVNAFIMNKLTKDFKYNPLTDVYWIVINISIGQVLPERYGNAVDAGEVAKTETFNTGLPHHIFKLVGKADMENDKVKVLKVG